MRWIVLLLLTGSVMASEWSGPDFFILGAAKSGTTSLYRYLSEHPDILSPLPDTWPLEKELHFLTNDRTYQRGKGVQTKYKKLFPEREHAGQLLFEATPFYLYHPKVPQRVLSHFPHAKLIIILRDPVERCYSEWRYSVSRGDEERPFLEAIAEELATPINELVNPQGRLVPRTNIYLARGLYLSLIQRWLQFFPKDQLCILFTKDLQEDPEMVMEHLWNFLDVSPYTLNTYPRHNEGTNQCAITQDERAVLEQFYAPHTVNLKKFLLQEFDLVTPF